MKTCNRKRSDMTPCVITDGPVAYGFKSSFDTRPLCVGCDRSPATTGVPEPKDWEKQCRDYLLKEKRRR